MRLAILTPGYPSETTQYNYAFVHARSRQYAARNVEVAVFAPGADDTYELDGIVVNVGGRSRLETALRSFRPEVLAIHAPNRHTIPIARRLDCRQVSWIHGHEALFSLRGVAFGRTRRERAVKAVKVVPRNLVQLALVRRFLLTQHRVIFVSNWMRSAAQRHTFRSYPNAEIVPNPIDTALFSYRLDPDNHRRGVTARSLNSTKYGIDVAIRAFGGLTAARLDIYGRGSLATNYQRLVRRAGANAELIERSIAHRDMPELFGRYGFFVAPSRVEAQGVAMCEAMACGLPVVATRAGGIPEFVTDGVEGYLVPPEDPPALRRAVERLVADRDRFLDMSRAARHRIERTCSGDVITDRELTALRGG